METAVSPQRAKVSDIAEILASRTLENGTEVLFYRAQDGNKYAACRAAGSDTLLRFTDEYNVYTDRYAIGTFTDLFGHDGFVLECPRGAAYYAYDYYYFDADGTPRLLADCSNYVIEQDLNGDGEKELLWFYHGAESYYYFERNGILFM